MDLPKGEVKERERGALRGSLDRGKPILQLESRTYFVYFSIRESLLIKESSLLVAYPGLRGRISTRTRISRRERYSKEGLLSLW